MLIELELVFLTTTELRMGPPSTLPVDSAPLLVLVAIYFGE